MECTSRAERIDALVGEHWNGDAMHGQLGTLRSEFRGAGFCVIERFVPDALGEHVAEDVSECLERAGHCRDLRIKATGGTPRRYRSVDRDDVFAYGPTIAALYRSNSFLRVLAEIAGEPEIICAPYEPEEIVINCMERAGDEHGWHWDDYRYSLVWVHKAPRRGNGGEVQLVHDTRWDKDDPQVEHYLRTRKIETRYIEEGAAYLLRGDIIMHRVSPLIEDDTRIITCFTYAGPDELKRTISHETMEELYPRRSLVTA
jgi:hypothetical protein